MNWIQIHHQNIITDIDSASNLAHTPTKELQNTTRSVCSPLLVPARDTPRWTTAYTPARGVGMSSKLFLIRNFLGLLVIVKLDTIQHTAACRHNTHIHTQPQNRTAHTHTHTFTHTDTHTTQHNTHTHTHTHTHTFTHSHSHIRTFAHSHIQTHTTQRNRTHKQAHINNKHTYTDTHTYTGMGVQNHITHA